MWKHGGLLREESEEEEEEEEAEVEKTNTGADLDLLHPLMWKRPKLQLNGKISRVIYGYSLQIQSAGEVFVLEFVLGPEQIRVGRAAVLSLCDFLRRGW